MALGRSGIIFREIKKLKHMKTVMEQLMEIQDQINSMKMHLTNTESFKAQSTEFTPCCDDECACNDEPETPQSSITAEEANVIVFTKDQLITFATHLTERVMDSCKEAVTNTCLDADSLVDLSLGCGNQIDVDLDQDAIVNSIQEEIDESVNTDADSVNDEVMSILDDMGIKS